MDLSDIIRRLSSDALPSLAAFEAWAAQSGLTLSGLLDRIAASVAVRFLKNELEWDDADVVMNHLFALAHSEAQIEMPPLAEQVFHAFDEGEYVHEPSPADPEGAARTRQLLTHIPLPVFDT